MVAEIFFSPESPKRKSESKKKSPLETIGSHSQLAFAVARTRYTHALSLPLSHAHARTLSLLQARSLAHTHALTHPSHSPLSSPSTGCRDIPGSLFPTEEMTDRGTDRRRRPTDETEIDASAEASDAAGPSKPKRRPAPRQEREHQLRVSTRHQDPLSSLGSSCSLSSLSLSLSLSLSHAPSHTLFLALSVD